MDVRQEGTGWRDESLSRRHRLWGYDCPAMDIDFLMVEYDRFIPKALIDYKCNSDLKIGEAGFRVLNNLGNMAHIPAFWVRYNPDLTEFTVNPINELAKNIFYHSESGQIRRVFVLNTNITLTESRFVGFLMFLRSKQSAQ